MKSRLLSTLLALCMALALVPAAFADDDPDEAGVTWSYRDGVLSINGTGPMADYELETAPMPWVDVLWEIHTVKISEGVTRIGTSAFDNCTALTDVTVPASVTSIGKSAFGWCFGLTGISVAGGNPAYVSVDGVLFSADQTLLHSYPAGKSDTSYSIPDTVTAIEHSAFTGAMNLTNVTIPDGVTAIEGWTFAGCFGLTDVVIPDGVTTIGEAAFRTCMSLTGVTIPASVTAIDMLAFEGCEKLTDVYYGGSESQWAEISIGTDNEALTGAEIHYGSADPDEPETPDEPGTPSEPETPDKPETPSVPVAHPSTQKVDLNGKEVEFQMYALKDENGNDTNHIKLRDLALALNGTSATFNIGWENGMAAIETGKAYTPDGSENNTPFSGERPYTVSAISFSLNGSPIELESIGLTDDAGNGYTYCQVKNLADKLNFTARWDAARQIICIETETFKTGM